MSFSDEGDIELLDRALARADYMEKGKVPMPELLVAVESTTHDAVSAEGMALREGSGGEMQIVEDPCQGLSLCFSRV